MCSYVWWVWRRCELAIPVAGLLDWGAKIAKGLPMNKLAGKHFVSLTRIQISNGYLDHLANNKNCGRNSVHFGIWIPVHYLDDVKIWYPWYLSVHDIQVLTYYPLPHVCRRLLKEGWILITYLFTWNLIKGSYLLKFPSEILKNSDDCFITQKTYKPNNLNHISVCIRCTIASPMKTRGGN